MSNSVQFHSFNFHSSAVRVIVDSNQEYWFCANDVCLILEYSNPRDAILKHCKEKGVAKRDTLTNRGNQVLTYINEPNLYRLIIKSRKPEAEPFEAWIFEEVLPQIRKTGKYEMIPNIEPRNYLNNNDMLNIKRLIWHCANGVDNKRAFNNAVWLLLRQVKGTPSPAKFEVEHLPILAKEFHRIINIIEPYLNARRECETALIKRLLHNYEDERVVLDGLLSEMKNSTQNFVPDLDQKLLSFFKKDYLRLLERGVCKTDHNEFNDLG